MAELVREHFPTTKLKSINRDKLMPKRGTLNVDKANSLIGYNPNWSLNKGYPKYIEWYKKFAENNKDLFKKVVKELISLKNIIIFLNGKQRYFNNRRDFKTRHKISTSVIPTGYKFNKVEEKIKSFGLSCIRLSNVNNQSSIKKLNSINQNYLLLQAFLQFSKKILLIYQLLEQ